MSGIAGLLSGIKEGITGLASSITSGIKNTLIEIFVPSEDFLSDKVDSIKEHFVFAESIMDTVDAISGALQESSEGPPRIEMNLSAAESKYDYGTNAVALDMSWFAKYKPTTDAILSAILWAFFIWRVYVSLPGIINGASGTVGAYDTYTVKMEKRGKS